MHWRMTGTVSAPEMSRVQAWPCSAEATVPRFRPRRDTAANKSRASSKMAWPTSQWFDQNCTASQLPMVQYVDALQKANVFEGSAAHGLDGSVAQNHSHRTLTACTKQSEVQYHQPQVLGCRKFVNYYKFRF
jgi:hypothetical protein